MADELCRELQNLVKTPAFGKYQKPSKEIDLDSPLDFVTLSYTTFQSVAPIWLQIFETAYSSSVFRNRPDQQSALPANANANVNASANATVPLWQIAILAILCHAVFPRNSNNFQATIGLYLDHGGVKRRLIETLNHLGVCLSYTTLHKRLAPSIGDATQPIEEVGQLPTSIVRITHDRFDQRLTQMDLGRRANPKQDWCERTRTGTGRCVR